MIWQMLKKKFKEIVLPKIQLLNIGLTNDNIDQLTEYDFIDLVWFLHYLLMDIKKGKKNNSTRS